ncbi:hypothetical protein [Streptomyces sp. NPDC001919]
MGTGRCTARRAPASRERPARCGRSALPGFPLSPSEDAEDGRQVACRRQRRGAHPVPAGRGRPLATFNVISDIQGDLRVLGVALEDMHRTHPGARDFASGTWLKQITVPLSTRI